MMKKKNEITKTYPANQVHPFFCNLFNYFFNAKIFFSQQTYLKLNK